MACLMGYMDPVDSPRIGSKPSTLSKFVLGDSHSGRTWPTIKGLLMDKGQPYNSNQESVQDNISHSIRTT
jgi:hypothetical protein